MINMTEIPIPPRSPVVQKILESLPPEGGRPVTPEVKSKEPFTDFLEVLGMIVDTHVVLDEIKGQKRDVGDIMKDVLASTEQQLAAAKAAREGKS